MHFVIIMKMFYLYQSVIKFVSPICQGGKACDDGYRGIHIYIISAAVIIIRSKFSITLIMIGN